MVKKTSEEPQKITGKDFLRLIKKRGVHVRLTKAALRDQEFMNLVGALSAMRMSGEIPNFVAEFII